MSKIFGELLMLIERDYRGESATLAYNGERFSVPKNLYLIGMMNTADRSLALIDYALRRRFCFFEIEPGFDSEGFARYQKDIGDSRFDALVDIIRELNIEISGDDSLGNGFRIGHSHLLCSTGYSRYWLREVVKYDLIPTLAEYWFDDRKKVEQWSMRLNGVLDD